MEHLLNQLKNLTEEIKVGIIGIGSIGKGLVYQCHITPGIKPVAIADIILDKAEDCAKWLDVDYEIVSSTVELNSAISRGVLAVCKEGLLIAASEEIAALIEASNAILDGAKHVVEAIEHGQHIIMMNYEAELMYGPLLLKKAEENKVVYTCADGDQPTVIKKLVDEIKFMGFELVMAGNIKGYMDRYTNPIKIAPEADKRSLDHKMCSSYTDGSKLNVEMAVLANALNLQTHIPGMYGRKMASIYDIFNAYNFEELYKDRNPVVDYVLGAIPKGGVFVIAYTEDKFQQYTLDWYPPDMGPGPFYLFYRPYHLGNIEALACVAEAVLYNNARLKPDYGMKTNVFCYAKKDLKAGDILDGMGGYCCYGLVENLADQEVDGVPICLADQIKLKRDYMKDDRIQFSDVELLQQREAFDLYFEALKT
jgi:predicted homoserine dehydrogenase-like protein